MDTGKSIAILLHEKGMKKKELAEKMEITPATVSALCQSAECSGRMLEKLCNAFDIKASEFIALGE